MVTSVDRVFFFFRGVSAGIGRYVVLSTGSPVWDVVASHAGAITAVFDEASYIHSVKMKMTSKCKMTSKYSSSK